MAFKTFVLPFLAPRAMVGPLKPTLSYHRSSFLTFLSLLVALAPFLSVAAVSFANCACITGRHTRYASLCVPRKGTVCSLCGLHTVNRGKG